MLRSFLEKWLNYFSEKRVSNNCIKPCSPQQFLINDGDYMTVEKTQQSTGVASDLNAELGIWKKLNECVYEHTSGLRVHTGGTIRKLDGTFISLGNIKQARQAERFIRICGGNKKRGLMLMAVNA